MEWRIDALHGEIIITIDVQSTSETIRRVHPDPITVTVHIPIVPERPYGFKRSNMLDLIHGYAIYECAGKTTYVAVPDE